MAINASNKALLTIMMSNNVSEIVTFCVSRHTDLSSAAARMLLLLLLGRSMGHISRDKLDLVWALLLLLSAQSAVAAAASPIHSTLTESL